MKKLILSLMVLGGLILLGTNVAEAQNVGSKKVQTNQTAQSGFVDTNRTWPRKRTRLRPRQR